MTSAGDIGGTGGDVLVTAGLTLHLPDETRARMMQSTSGRKGLDQSQVSIQVT